MSVSLGLALAANLVLAALALAVRALTPGGAAAGVAVGAAVLLLLGWPGYAVLAAFVVVGSGATRWRRVDKAARGIAQEAGGRRAARHVAANSGVALAAAALVLFEGTAALAAAAFTGAFAAAAADTVGSEVGKAAGRPRRLPGLRPVAAGTPGAVSAAGTLAGVAAAGLIAGVGAAAGLISWAFAPAVAAAGALASLLESLLGGRHRPRLGHEALNLANTLAGALLATLAARLWT